MTGNAGTRYLGIDLAWSERSGAGVCVIDGGGEVLHEDQPAPAELPAWVLEWRDERSVLALDGPLIVPAGSGVLRDVERELHRRFGRFHAGPFPGGAGSTAMRGRDRSPAQALVDAVGGTVVDPGDRTSAHRAIEVFPAPSWIALFGLTERIVYKRGRKAARIEGLTRLGELVETLAGADLPFRGPVDGVLASRLATARTARDWKAVEDIIDARLCAYVALAWDRLGTPEWVVTGAGGWQDGYIVIPQPATWDQQAVSAR
jgi:predicted RNase H-like nuclease